MSVALQFALGPIGHPSKISVNLAAACLSSPHNVLRLMLLNNPRKKIAAIMKLLHQDRSLVLMQLQARTL